MKNIPLLIFLFIAVSCENFEFKLNNKPESSFTISSLQAFIGDTIRFTDTSENKPDKWDWDFGDGKTDTVQSPVHCYTSRGNFKVALKVTNKHGSDSISSLDTIVIEVNYGSVTDIDGNVYKTVPIGDQNWMAENLKVTHYPNGKEIPKVSVGRPWGTLADNNTDAAYTISNSITFYTYAAAINVCPVGWHLPSKEDWTKLIDYNTSNGLDARALKGTNYWWGYHGESSPGTDNYGFAAYQTGVIDYYFLGNHIAEFYAHFWNSTEFNDSTAYLILIPFNDGKVNFGSINKSTGIAVRCVKD